MIKWVLLVVLLVSALITIATGASVILDVYAFASRFGISLDVPTETAVAISTVGTPIATSSLFTFLAAYWVLIGHPGARGVAMVCGLMLVMIGVSIYIFAGIPQLLYMDSLRGLVVMTLSYLYVTSGTPPSRAQ